MTPFVLLAVLGSAFLHAMWNSLVKTGASRLGAMVVLSVCEVPIGLAVAALRPLPALDVVPWVLASGLVHFFYKFFLTYAYERGDLSRVYPIARGTAPLVVALLSGAVLTDVVTPVEFAGISLLGFGILMMAQGVFAQGENRRLIPFALGSAASYGAYGISVWAMTVAPIALVAALRETSILFAVLIGWLGFGERMTRGKGLAALVIVAGVVITRL